MSSSTIADLSTQLRLLLESSSDPISTNDLLARVDSFVLECSASPEASALLHQLEEELQRVYDDALWHALFPQAELFLAFLYHLRPVLPSLSIISTWFDLVLRPTLREPKVPLSTANHAKELIISALDPGNNFSGAEDGSPEADKQKERVGDFRRRLMDLYLLDAYNESSGDDVLEWAELDEDQRENKACWKSNLEDVLVRVGLERPKVCPFVCTISSSGLSRIQRISSPSYTSASPQRRPAYNSSFCSMHTHHTRVFPHTLKSWHLTHS